MSKISQRFAKRGKMMEYQTRSGLGAPVNPIAYYVFESVTQNPASDILETAEKEKQHSDF